MLTEEVRQKADQAVFKTLVAAMLIAAEKLRDHWEDSGIKDDTDFTNDGYPFNKSFDDVVCDMLVWHEKLHSPKTEPPLPANLTEDQAKLVPTYEHKVTKKFTSGSRVRFVRIHDVGLHPTSLVVPVGSLGTVKEINGSEGTEAWVELDSYYEILDEWDNCIIFSMEDQEHGTYMDRVLETAEPDAKEKIVTDFRCPSCDSAALITLAPQLYVYEVKGVRHGRVITTDSVNVVDHPDQDVQTFECLNCEHEWVDNDVPVAWCEAEGYNFAEEDYSRAYDKLCNAMNDRDDVSGIRRAAEDLAKAAKAFRK